MDSFVPDNGVVPFELAPGLNRVCVLVDELDELPDEVFEEGQCHHVAYVR
jgi:hypothetical protein